VYETLKARVDRLSTEAKVCVLMRRNRAPIVAKLDSGDYAVLPDHENLTEITAKIIKGQAKSTRLAVITVSARVPSKLFGVHWDDDTKLGGMWLFTDPVVPQLSFQCWEDAIQCAENHLMKVCDFNRVELAKRIIGCLPSGFQDDFRIQQSIEYELAASHL
jgi:hypothetical protein